MRITSSMGYVSTRITSSMGYVSTRNRHCTSIGVDGIDQS